MALVALLIVVAVLGIFSGIKNKSKSILFSSIGLLVFVIAALLVYSYLYSKNPY